ncbi:tRNA (N6-threonylcarbamoyladenosine(37)-N6)-methyltransferase TrmO [Sulfurisphaera javensis]|uniref:tRNA (N6-threonylcarbamoyladenosine(37)-N6)-methyltransferase TrmO n=1 Tax=Sulfurisphaera javensis TaxID=2049879 RepID=A0AAT9GPV8_9CREN
MSVCFKYIGYIKRKDNSASRHEIVEVHVNKEYEDGLTGIEEFSHLILVYHLHLVNFDGRLLRERENRQIGIFATRSQHRPNPIGISVCELIKRENNILYVKGVNAYNGTPVLDIKPYDEWDRIEKIRVPSWHNAR